MLGADILQRVEVLNEADRVYQGPSGLAVFDEDIH